MDWDNKSYAIENKVHYASDQEKQIERYINKTISYDFSEKNIFVYIYHQPMKKNLKNKLG